MSGRPGPGQRAAAALLGLLVAAAGPGAAAAFQPGGGRGAPSPLDRLERAVRQPSPALPPAPGRPADRVWVPDRHLDTPAGPAHVPGHWERRLSGTETHAPPLTACTAAGHCVTVPAGVRPAPELRQTP